MTDFSEVSALRASLGDVPARTQPFVRKAIEITARNVKDDARSFANYYFGNGSARHYPSSMEYEIKDGGMTAEIGPRPGGQGNLAPIFETGNPFSGRKPSLEPALAGNVSDFVEGLTKALIDGLRL